MSMPFNYINIKGLSSLHFPSKNSWVAEGQYERIDIWNEKASWHKIHDYGQNM